MSRRFVVGARVLWVTGNPQMGTASWTGKIVGFDKDGDAEIAVEDYPEAVAATIPLNRLTILSPTRHANV